MVGVAVFGAVFVWMFASSINDGAVDEPPRIILQHAPEGPGAILTVIRATEGMDWSQAWISDSSVASCTLPTGDVGPGDQIVCTTEGSWLLLYGNAGDSTIIYDGAIH